MSLGVSNIQKNSEEELQSWDKFEMRYWYTKSLMSNVRIQINEWILAGSDY